MVAFNLDEAVTVTYIVTRNGIPSNPSKPLSLTVLPIADEDPVMGMPLITQAANNGAGPELNVSALTAAGTMRVNSYPLIALRQYVWLRVTGTDKNEKNYDKTFWQPPTSQTNSRWISQGFYTHSIPLLDLQDLKDGSELIMEFKVGLGGSQDERQATTFKKRIYTVKAVEDVRPEITSVKGSPSGADIPPGGTTVETAITLSGTAAKGQEVEVRDGTISKGPTKADAITGEWTLPISGLTVASHSFTALALYGTGQVSQPPRVLTVNEAEIVITNFGPDTQFRNGQTVAIKSSTLTYRIISGNPTYCGGGENLLSLVNGIWFANPGLGQHKVIIDLKNRPLKTFSMEFRAYLVVGTDHDGAVIGTINLLGPQGIVHTQKITSLTHEQTINAKLTNNSYSSIEIIQDKAPTPNFDIHYYITKITCGYE